MHTDFEADLEDLRWHWGEAYVIECFGLGRWLAQRRDGRGTIRADSALLLRDMIVADYMASPVARSLATLPSRSCGRAFLCIQPGTEYPNWPSTDVP
jgi:hypothetical protein